MRKTSRLVIAHEGWKSGGFGAEVSAMVAETGDRLARCADRPHLRPDYADALQRQARAAMIPSADDIVEAVKTVVLRDRVGAGAVA